ncbi:MAG: tetratricopeptide repeat protein [bacterium]
MRRSAKIAISLGVAAAVGLVAVGIFLFIGQPEREREIIIRIRVQDSAGVPLEGAAVYINEREVGRTNSSGAFEFRGMFPVKSGVESGEVLLKVTKRDRDAGFLFEPWEESFVLLPRARGEEPRTEYDFVATMKGTKFFTIVTKVRGEPLPDTEVAVNGSPAGKTDYSGYLDYNYVGESVREFRISVNREGYLPWNRSIRITPGDEVVIDLEEVTQFSFKTRTEAYDIVEDLKGVSVIVDGKYVGATDSKGEFSYAYVGARGRKIDVQLKKKGYFPGWREEVYLEDDTHSVSVERFLYPLAFEPIRVGIYRIENNSVGDRQVEGIVEEAERAMEKYLSQRSSFAEVSGQKVRQLFREAEMGWETITTKGWAETSIARSLDMVIWGSVTKLGPEDILMESKVYTSTGKLLVSVVKRISPKDVDATARDTVHEILEEFPFEGRIVEIKGNAFKINLGKDHLLEAGGEVIVKKADMTPEGKIKGWNILGTAKIASSDKESAILAPAEIENLALGDKIVKKVGEDLGGDGLLTLQVKGSDTGKGLSYVNVYRGDAWMGSTDDSGVLTIPVQVNKPVDILLYKNGYIPIRDSFAVRSKSESKVWTMPFDSVYLVLETDPPGAKFWVEGEEIGRTPYLLKDRAFKRGFNRLTIDAGKDYRIFDRVMDFNSKTVDFTGKNKIRLEKNYYAWGKKLEEEGKIDAAINMYSQITNPESEDYSDAHNRLAQIYLDVKRDYDRAVSEFASFMELPQNRQLLDKRFAIVYLNWGRAYYLQGESISGNDEAAIKSYTRAIETLKLAEQNKRFFPKDSYDEAVHDLRYYIALSYHKLYYRTKDRNLLREAYNRWYDYFDFFPESLEGKKDFERAKDGAKVYFEEAQKLLGR